MPQADVLLNYFSQVIKEDVGLTIINTRGNKCKRARRCSRDEEVHTFVKNLPGEPCWEIWNIIREYIAPNTVERPTTGNNHTDHFMRAVRIIISPIRLGEGGRPSFEAHIRSHHMVLNGKISFSPRVIDRVRVLLRSYTVLARENRAEETNP